MAHAVYSFDGILTFVLLFICTCAYIRHVPRLKETLLSDKKGVFGTFFKGLFVCRDFIPIEGAA